MISYWILTKKELNSSWVWKTNFIIMRKAEKEGIMNIFLVMYMNIIICKNLIFKTKKAYKYPRHCRIFFFKMFPYFYFTINKMRFYCYNAGKIIFY